MCGFFSGNPSLISLIRTVSSWIKKQASKQKTASTEPSTVKRSWPRERPRVGIPAPVASTRTEHQHKQQTLSRGAEVSPERCQDPPFQVAPHPQGSPSSASCGDFHHELGNAPKNQQMRVPTQLCFDLGGGTLARKIPPQPTHESKYETGTQEWLSFSRKKPNVLNDGTYDCIGHNSSYSSVRARSAWNSCSRSPLPAIPFRPKARVDNGTTPRMFAPGPRPCPPIPTRRWLPPPSS